MRKLNMNDFWLATTVVIGLYSGTACAQENTRALHYNMTPVVEPTRVPVAKIIQRGADAELGLHLSDEDAKRCLTLGSLTVSTSTGELVVNGVLDLRLARDCVLTAVDIIEVATSDARDAWERDRYVAIPMEHEALHAFTVDRTEEDGKMSGYGLVTAQLAFEQSFDLDVGLAPRP